MIWTCGDHWAIRTWSSDINCLHSEKSLSRHRCSKFHHRPEKPSGNLVVLESTRLTILRRPVSVDCLLIQQYNWNIWNIPQKYQQKVLWFQFLLNPTKTSSVIINWTCWSCLSSFPLHPTKNHRKTLPLVGDLAGKLSRLCYSASPPSLGGLAGAILGWRVNSPQNNFPH